jgi:hypothetical protein
MKMKKIAIKKFDRLNYERQRKILKLQYPSDTLNDIWDRLEYEAEWSREMCGIDLFLKRRCAK